MTAVPNAHLIPALPEDQRGFVDFCRAHARMMGPVDKQKLPELVDELGTLKAGVAEMTTREKEIKDEIARRVDRRSSDNRVVEGRYYKVTVVFKRVVRINRPKVEGWLRSLFPGWSEKKVRQTIDEHMTNMGTTTQVIVSARQRDEA